MTPTIGLRLSFIFATLVALDVGPSLRGNDASNEALRQEIALLRARLEQLEARVAATPSTASEAPSVVPVVTAAPVPRVPPSAVAEPPYKLKLYGFVKVDAFHETQDTFTDAIPFWVCEDNAMGSNGNGEFGLTAKESRLGALIEGPALGSGRLHGQFEFDFYGNTALNNHHAYTPRSRHLFVEWRSPEWSVLAGETWETYLIAFPKTLNFSYYNLQGQLGLRRTQVRVTRSWTTGADGRWSLQAALAEPLAGINGADFDGDLQDDAADADLPMMEYKLEYQRKGFRLGLAGFWGREHVDRMATSPARDYESWAVILGGEFPLGNDFSVRGTIWTGTNLDSAWGAIGQGINYGMGRTIDASGGWLQLEWRATSDLSFNLGYSVDDPRDNDLNPGQRSVNESMLLNAFYRLNANVTLGLELLHLRTGFLEHGDSNSFRTQSSVKYTF